MLWSFRLFYPEPLFLCVLRVSPLHLTCIIAHNSVLIQLPTCHPSHTFTKSLANFRKKQVKNFVVVIFLKFPSCDFLVFFLLSLLKHNRSSHAEVSSTCSNLLFLQILPNCSKVIPQNNIAINLLQNLLRENLTLLEWNNKRSLVRIYLLAEFGGRQMGCRGSLSSAKRAKWCY